MNFKEISADKLADFNPFEKISSDWFLVTAGDKSGYNTMTASWGFMGIIWNKKSAVTVIRPQRYTKEFVDNSELFTISFFKEDEREALKFCGSHSGRDFDKARETGLTPLFLDNTVSFEQAETILVCKKMYSGDIRPEGFIDKNLISSNYPSEDFHTAYIGEIIKCYTKQ